jgi:pimeloyl-ACP methyl ester carboxylesterase
MRCAVAPLGRRNGGVRFEGLDQRTIPMRDGRVLAIARYGVPGGEPVVYCHGVPGSRWEAALLHPTAQALGCTVITFDRPGLGRSDRRAARSVAATSDDVRDLADVLGLKAFAVVGVSGGAPHAAACAANLPDRVHACALVAGLAPIQALGRGPVGLSERLLAQAARHPKRIQHLARRAATPARWSAGAAIRALQWRVDASDRSILRRPAVGQVLSASYAEAFRAGGAGLGDELIALTSSWRVDCTAIRGPVQVWHGQRDRIVPPDHGAWWVGQLPRGEAYPESELGHFALPIDRAAAILQHLLAARAL